MANQHSDERFLGNIILNASAVDSIIQAGSPVGNITLTLPSVSGTIALLSDIAGNNELHEILTNGNTTNDGQTIEALNGGGLLNLREGSNDTVLLDNNAGGYGNAGLYLSDDYGALFFDGWNAAWDGGAISGAPGESYITSYVPGVVFSIRSDGPQLVAAPGFVMGITGGLYDVQTTNPAAPGREIGFILGGALNRVFQGTENSGIVGGAGNIVNTGVDRTVIVGGTSIFATKSDHTYVANLGFHTPGFGNYTTTISNLAATADRTINFPDASGTVALLSDVTAADELSEVLANGNTSGGNPIIMSNNDSIRFAAGANGLIEVDTDVSFATTGWDLTLKAGEANFQGLNILGHGGDLILQGGTAQNAAGQKMGDVTITTVDAVLGNAGNININLGTGASVGGLMLIPTSVTTKKGFYLGGEGNLSDTTQIQSDMAAGLYQFAIGGNIDGSGTGGARMAYHGNNESVTGTQYVLANDGVTAGVVTWVDINTIIPNEDHWDLTVGGDLETSTGNSPDVPNVLPRFNDTQDLGSSAKRWKDLYLGSKIDFLVDLEFNLNTANIITVDTNGVQVANNKYIESANKSVNGGGRLNLAYGGTANSVGLTTDGDNWLSGNLYLDQNEGSFGFGYVGSVISNGLKATASSTSLHSVDLQVLTIADVSSGNLVLPSYIQDGTRFRGVVINTNGATVNSGVDNSVILGGVGITATASNTVYVPDVYMQNGKSISAQGGGELDLRNGGDGTIFLGNNKASWHESLYMTDGYIELSSYQNTSAIVSLWTDSVSLEINEADKRLDYSASDNAFRVDSNFAWLTIGGYAAFRAYAAGAGSILGRSTFIATRNDVSRSTTDQIDNYPALISSRSTAVEIGVTNSVGLGGVKMSIKTDDSAYVNQIAFNRALGEFAFNPFEIILRGVIPTADRLIELPDASGTVALTSGLTGNGIYDGSDLLSGNTYVDFDANTLQLGDSMLISDTQLHIGSLTATNPGAVIYVAGTSNPTSSILMDRYSSNTGGGGYSIRKARGSETVPTAVIFGDKLGTIKMGGYGTTGFITTTTQMASYAEETFTDSSAATSLRFSTTPTGSITDVERLRIAPDGNVGIGEIAPTAKLDVNGSVRFRNLTTTPAAGYVLQSTDANGNADWVDPAATTPTKYKGTFAPGTVGVANTINHGLNTQDVMVQIWYANKMISADTIEAVDANNVEITFTGSNPSGEVSPDVVDVRIIGL